MPKPHDSVRVFQEHIYGDQRRKKGSKIWSKFERAPSRNFECFLASPVVKSWEIVKTFLRLFPANLTLTISWNFAENTIHDFPDIVIFSRNSLNKVLTNS